MNFTFAPLLDKTSDGRPRLIRAASPTYRFSLVLSRDGQELMTIEGFRIDSRLKRIIPPSSQGRNQAYSIIWLSPDFEKAVIEALRPEIEPQN